MHAEQHHRAASRLRALYAEQHHEFSFNNLLPALARIHDNLAEGNTVTPVPQIDSDAIDVWASQVCRSLVGIKVRPKIKTTWDIWVERQLHATARNARTGAAGE